MPTAAKLFAAFSFALVGFFTAEVLKPSFPESFAFGWFSVICALLGFLAGWRVMGPDAGNGVVKSASSGLKTSFVLTIWGLTVFSVREMLIESTRFRYNGVMDALRGIFEFMLEFATIMVENQLVFVVLAVGGMLGGMFSSWAATRWR